jgi:hypothetical protein
MGAGQAIRREPSIALEGATLSGNFASAASSRWQRGQQVVPSEAGAALRCASQAQQ